MQRHTVTLHLGANSGATGTNNTIQVHLHLQRNGQGNTTKAASAGSGYNGYNEMQVSFSTVLEPGDVITSSGYNYRSSGATGHFSVVAQP